MHTGDDAAVAKLQEQLSLCRQELAHVRRQQEESATTEADIERDLARVTAGFDRRLTAGETLTGARGWIKRRLLSTMPRSSEHEALAVLRSSALMAGGWYLRRYPQVAGSGLSPALHYLRIGAQNGLDPGPTFNTRSYVQQHPELPSGMNPLVHHLAAAMRAKR